MTKREKKLQDREWLRERMFAVTNSLKRKLAEVGVDEKEHRRLCAFQSVVLHQMAYKDDLNPEIYYELLQNKCGANYTDSRAKLWGLGELDGKDSYWAGKGDCKSYWVPTEALDSGLTAIRFVGERTQRRKRQETAPDGVSSHALHCLQQLETPLKLQLPHDPLDEYAIREHMVGIFFGDFQLRYGKKVNRLYHRGIEIPRVGRRNLYHSEPLFDFDVGTCAPVLLLSLIEDPDERRRYREDLEIDLYNVVAEETGLRLKRDPLKKEFARVVNAQERESRWLQRHPITSFFKRRYPKFTDCVFLRRRDLGQYLQNLEASIMIRGVGSWCLKERLFWIPQHDGFLSPYEQGKEIEKKAVQLFEEKVQYTVHLKNINVQKIEGRE